MAGLDKVRMRSFEIDLGETYENGDKRIRYLRFDMNAFAALEDHFGSIEEAMKALEKGSVKGMITLLWAGLIHEDEDLTVKKVGSMIDFGDIQNISAVITKAMQVSMPDVKEDASKNATRPSKTKKASQ